MRIAWLCLVLLAGCPPMGGKAPEVLADGQSIGVATALDFVDEQTRAEAPERLAKALDQQLKARKLSATVAADLPASFGTSGDTAGRLAALASATDTDLLLLLEAKPVFDSQIAGRFRWSVAVELTLAKREDLATAATIEWSIPVFLQFYHQQEPEALAEATPMIERRLDRALDEFLRGL